MASSDIRHAPPPWVLKGDVYMFPFWTNQTQIDAANASGVTFSPLEAKSAFASPEGNRHIGGLSMIQVIRYTESPVGPYDEMMIIPGTQEYTVEAEGGKRVKKRNMRITRIYVSQKHTCWNGRTNWNIPKHLAAFDFQQEADSTTVVKVFPHDTQGDSAEAAASPTPFFQAKFKPVPLVPSFPSSTDILKYVGLDPTLVLPPLPAGAGSQGELPGTEQWCEIVPTESTRRTTIGWFDVNQTDEKGNVTGEYENFWPGIKRWHLGVKMEDAKIDFPNGRHWDSPRSVL